LSNLGMGGDWYDLVELDGGRIGAVVGDVVGHGVTAVAEMARLKTTIATLVGMGVEVDGLFPLAHRIIGGAESFRGTALYAELDPTGETLRVSMAGHPPPIVRTADGAVGVVSDGSRYPVLGIGPTASATSTPRPFRSGDTFVAYTDGLIERRGKVLDDGIGQLVDILREVGDRSVDEVADEIVGRLGPEGDDDVALLVIRNAT
jgi:serine phosphatase RsbU (regulator of sigma subunit)